MNVLDSPLEALAFNYLSFGLFTVVNNLWTWVAVLTAAVSFWRFRAAVSTSVALQPDSPTQNEIDRSHRAVELPPSNLTAESPAPSSTASASALVAAVSSVCDAKDSGATKGKFTVYYEDDSGNDNQFAVREEWDDGDTFDGIGVGGDQLFNGWKRVVVRMRMEDMGWYGFQDLTVINGNVVRLWDECRSRRLECVTW